MKLSIKQALVVVPFITLAGCTSPLAQSSSSPSSLPSPSTTSADYLVSEVNQHNTPSSCWVIVDNNVYDITTFGPQHPGGDKIYQGCGQDISNFLKTAHKPVNNILPQYRIGKVK